MFYCSPVRAVQRCAAPRVQQSGACFYEHINFEGRYFCFRSGTSDDNIPHGLNNEISSIRIFGDAQVVVYKDGNFHGSSRHFESNVSDSDPPAFPAEKVYLATTDFAPFGAICGLLSATRPGVIMTAVLTLDPGATSVWPKVALPPLLYSLVSQGVVLRGGP